MFVIFLGGQIAGRKYDVPTALFLICGILLLFKPLSIVQSSFWLSVGSLLVISVFLPKMKRLFPKMSTPGIWLGTLPLNLYFFSIASPWGILLNILVLPAIPFIMLLGLAGCLASFGIAEAGQFFIAPVGYLFGFISWMCQKCNALPGNHLFLGHTSMWQMGIYYVILLGGAAFWERKAEGRLERKGRRLHRAARGIYGCLLILLASLILNYHGRLSLRFIALDIGQGDCNLLMLPTGETIMIDCGSSSEEKVWEKTVEQVLCYYGIDELDYVFLSHADGDHINGIEQLLQNYHPDASGKNQTGVSIGKLIVSPDENFYNLIAEAKSKHISTYEISAGNSMRGANWKMTCIAPDKEKLTGDSNQDSMVLSFQIGKLSILFTGDLEKEAEVELSKHVHEHTVLKVGHHGSKNATSDFLLEAVNPRAALISAGRNNRYGHPNEEVLQRLLAAGITVFRTDQGGAVILTMQEGKIEIQSYMERGKKTYVYQ